jgi:hypothetical protein
LNLTKKQRKPIPEPPLDLLAWYNFISKGKTNKKRSWSSPLVPSKFAIPATIMIGLLTRDYIEKEIGQSGESREFIISQYKII